MTWIPVLDTKPEDLQQVLIFDDVDEYIIGYYHEAGGVFVGSVDGARISKARFWKILPESPVEGSSTRDTAATKEIIAQERADFASTSTE